MSNNLIIQALPWDSEFFHLRIGRVDIHTKKDWKQLQQTLKSSQTPFEVLYVFSHTGVPAPIPRARLVDTKIVYRKKVSRTNLSENRCILEFKETVPDEALYQLALISGQHSRFNIDDRFPFGSYERLYRKWIENSVNGIFAKVVLCFVEGDTKVGFVTIGEKDGEGEIGLIAVDPHWQGRGIGSQLIQAAERWLETHRIDYLRVATQQDNVAACHFYENCGFVKNSVTDIYHLWI